MRKKSDRVAADGVFAEGGARQNAHSHTDVRNYFSDAAHLLEFGQLKHTNVDRVTFN